MCTKDQEQILAHIQSDAVNKDLNTTHQNRHIPSSSGYIEGRSFLYDDVDPKALSFSIHYSKKGAHVVPSRRQANVSG